jgi:hypothetical protein
MHEAIEAYLAIRAGVSSEAVARFDKRKLSTDSEPGDDPAFHLVSLKLPNVRLQFCWPTSSVRASTQACIFTF